MVSLIKTNCMSKPNQGFIIEPRSGLFNLKLGELWRYRDLILLFVKRDFVAVYKQTILGPLWFFIQPVLTTIIFTVVFGSFGKLSTEGIPAPLFYLSGLVVWTYFAECLTKTSETFIRNQNIFGKVYFPRLAVPISVVISNLMKFSIQFLLLIAFWIYYYIKVGGFEISPTILLLPGIIILLSLLGLGFGILFSAMTTKYRDLNFLLLFGVQLLMFLSSVVIPLSQIPTDKQWFLRLNPVLNLIEAFKYSLLGAGSFSLPWLLYSLGFTIVLLISGIVVFNKVERSFMDTI